MTSDWQASIPQDALVLAAVSGGADSLFLALHLRDELRQGSARIELVHVNHGLRGAESDGDEAFVRDFAGRHGFALHVQRIEPSLLMAASGEPRPPDEATLRRARLGVLRALASALGASAIALGHHGDDLAESFLLMAMRGSGPLGLSAMPEVRRLREGNLHLIRPLLGMTRSQIRDAMARRGETWREDSSNADLRYRRNRLRAEVLPLLAEIDRGAVANLAESARLIGEVAEWQDRLASDESAKAILAEGEGAVLFATEPLRLFTDRTLQAVVLRRFWLRCAGHGLDGDSMPHPPGRDTYRRLVERLRSDHGDTARFENEAQCRAFMTNSFGFMHSTTITFAAALAIVANGFPFPLRGEREDIAITPDGTAVLRLLNGDVTSSRHSLLEFMPRDLLRKDLAFALLDAGAIRGSLRLRHPDHNEPVEVGPRMHKTFRRCVREARVPDFLVDHIPAVCDDEGILWIPTIRRAQRALITDDTTTAVRFEWLPKGT